MSALTRQKTNKGLKKRKRSKSKSVTISRRLVEAKEEVKLFDDYDWSAETIDDYTAPSRLMPLEIPQGVTQSTRAGNKVFIKRLFIKMKFEGSASQNLASIKLAVVKDLQPMAQYAGALTAAQLWYIIWQDTGNATHNMLALPNPGYKDRFKIIKNMGVPMQPQGAYWDTGAANPRFVPNTTFLDVSIPINEMVTYQGSATGQPVAGCNYYVFAWSDTNANTTKVWASTRVYFTDA